MELRGFEPRIQPCHGRVIPFHYSPEGECNFSRGVRRVKLLTTLYARRSPPPSGAESPPAIADHHCGVPTTFSTCTPTLASDSVALEKEIRPIMPIATRARRLDGAMAGLCAWGTGDWVMRLTSIGCAMLHNVTFFKSFPRWACPLHRGATSRTMHPPHRLPHLPP